MTRPRLLLYCQHSVGMGHLVRSLVLADALTTRFEVVLLSGGAVPADVPVPPAVRLVQLPPLGHDDGYELVSRDPRWSLEEAQRLRVERILGEVQAVRPAVVLVELFPFGRRKFAFELLPMLEACWALSPRPVDPLQRARHPRRVRGATRLRHDEQASAVANRWFDGVLVHADPRFARLEESFAPHTPLAVPVHYTGFVTRPAGTGPAAAWRREGCACPPAAGWWAGSCSPSLSEPRRPMLDELGLDTTIVTGPFLPAEELADLEAASVRHAGLHRRRIRAAPRRRDGRRGRLGEPVRIQHGHGRAVGADAGSRRALRRRAGGRAAPPRPPPGGAGCGHTARGRPCCRRPPSSMPSGGLDSADPPRRSTLAPRRRHLHCGARRFDPRRRRGRLAPRWAMTPWLDPLLGMLDASTHPIVFFFRDDDVGWGDERLWALLDRFDGTATPVDLAVIPALLTAQLTAELRRRRERSNGRVALHQHGWAHVNHETAGRRCEFGASRRTADVRADVRRGQAAMAAAFGRTILRGVRATVESLHRGDRSGVAGRGSTGVVARRHGRALRPRRSRRSPGHRRLVRQAKGRRPRRRQRNGDSCWRPRRLGRGPSA